MTNRACPDAVRPLLVGERVRTKYGYGTVEKVTPWWALVRFGPGHALSLDLADVERVEP